MAAIGGGPRARVAEGQARWQRPAHAASGPGPGRRAQSPFGQFAGPRARKGAGNIFAPCMISGPSTRKRPLGGKIRAPCILNRPIAPGNECIGRRCCHLDLEKHAFRADIAREGAFFAHSAKREYIWCDSCQPRPRGRRNARGRRGWRRAVARCGRWDGAGVQPGLPERAGLRLNGHGKQRGDTWVGAQREQMAARGRIGGAVPAVRGRRMWVASSSTAPGWSRREG